MRVEMEWKSRDHDIAARKETNERKWKQTLPPRVSTGGVKINKMNEQRSVSGSVMPQFREKEKFRMRSDGGQQQQQQQGTAGDVDK